MGTQRNGARTFLEILSKCCKLSHTPGFRLGVDAILGIDAADTLIAVWTPVCTTVELLISSDDFFNKKDAGNPSLTGGEDVAPL